MGFFTKKQVQLNAVAFSFDDYEELNHDQLVEVNGGCGGGFWSGVKNFFSGGKPSSSSSSGSSSGSGSSSSSSSSTTTSSSNGGCGGNKSTTEKKETNTSDQSPVITRGDPDQNPNLSTMIESSILSHTDDKYIASSDPNKEWRCDNYAEAIVEQAGGDTSKIFAGDATKNSVQDHIDYGTQKNNLQETKKNSAPTLSDGAYVVFMNNSTTISEKTGKPLDPHCGIIIVQNGEISFSDNSSGNNNGLGGAATTEYNSMQAFQNDYGYNSFYYQSVTEKQ